MSVPGEVTGLLRRSAEGDRSAQDELFHNVYTKLHEMAAQKIRAERRDHTIQPTALIHEAYLVLIRTADISFVDRAHFFAVAGRVMRRILIDYARNRAAAKRPASRKRIDIERAQVFSLNDPEFVLALDQSLEKLRGQSERACQVVELRAFGGFSLDDIAESLGVSTRTVKRDWQTAKAWLYQDLYGGSGKPAPALG